MNIIKISDSPMKKGLSLPINLIVILAIAILVMVVVAAFFVGAVTPGIGGISLDSALGKACQVWRDTYACSDDAITIKNVKYKEKGDAAPKDYSVEKLCEIKGWSESRTVGTGANAVTVNECKRNCGCPSESSGAAPAGGPATPGE